MKKLRDKANAERHKSKTDKKITTVENDKDLFKAECLALDGINKEQKKVMAQLK
jgi:hypothetical protein